jgi:hypothetical protein
VKEIETAVDTFEERSDRVDATDLEANPDEMKTVTERQEIRERLAVVPAEVVRRPEATDTSRRPCTAKRKFS